MVFFPEMHHNTQIPVDSYILSIPHRSTNGLFIELVQRSHFIKVDHLVVSTLLVLVFFQILCIEQDGLLVSRHSDSPRRHSANLKRGCVNSMRLTVEFAQEDGWVDCCILGTFTRCCRRKSEVGTLFLFVYMASKVQQKFTIRLTWQ